tara:strand:- start:8080 stop:8409 length:330 start_codon:yes stop_codon:yes gene_type:complete
MATTYAWSFELKAATSPVDGKDDVIKEVHWRFIATTDDDPPLAPNAYGSVALGNPDHTFVEFNSVTKEMCREWVLAYENKTENELRAALDQHIAAVKSPAVASKVPSSW